jgi:hypothetical protein
VIRFSPGDEPPLQHRPPDVREHVAGRALMHKRTLIIAAAALAVALLGFGAFKFAQYREAQEREVQELIERIERNVQAEQPRKRALGHCEMGIVGVTNIDDASQYLKSCMQAEGYDYQADAVHALTHGRTCLQLEMESRMPPVMEHCWKRF